MNEEKNKLNDEKLEQVQGGTELMTQEVRYCKYCKKETKQIYIGQDYGWDNIGFRHWCNRWSCDECGKTNYWDNTTNNLI